MHPGEIAKILPLMGNEWQDPHSVGA